MFLRASDYCMRLQIADIYFFFTITVYLGFYSQRYLFTTRKGIHFSDIAKAKSVHIEEHRVTHDATDAMLLQIQHLDIASRRRDLV